MAASRVCPGRAQLTVAWVTAEVNLILDYGASYT